MLSPRLSEVDVHQVVVDLMAVPADELNCPQTPNWG